MGIGFPGLGIKFNVNPVLIRFTDSFAIYWYGLIIAVGFLGAVIYCLRQAKRFSLIGDEVIDMLFFATPAGIVCARLYYVIFNWSDYSSDRMAIIRTWDGGMAIYGGIIGAVAAAALFCWVRHISIGAILDLGAMGLLIGQAVGRWGNFVNGEVYGHNTDVFWRMTVGNREVHPLFLYESLWCAAGLFLLRFLIMPRRKYNGQMFMVYIAWYGLGRGIFEGMRDETFNLMLGNMKVSQALAFSSCVIALVLLFVFTILRKHEPDSLTAWVTGHDEYLNYKKERKAKKAGVTEGTIVTTVLSDDNKYGIEDNNNEVQDESVEPDDAPEEE